MKKILLALALASAPCLADWNPETAIHEVKDGKTGFVHPGIGLNRGDLLNLARHVKNGDEPWKSAYEGLVKHDHRFSMKPRVFTRRGDDRAHAIDSPDFDNRCQLDSESAFCQAVLYVLDGDIRHREYAMDVVRWFPANISSGRPHWDSQFRWPNAERWYLMACEMLRYTGPTEGPLAWTEQDTEDVGRFIGYGENLWWGRGSFLNQLHFTLGGPLARAIWRDDRAMYDEMVEILTYNRDGPVGEQNGSIREMCRLVTTNELTGAAVKPHVQFTEMGRDIGHPFPGSQALISNLVILRSQRTKVHPVSGRVSRGRGAVEPIEFLGHRFLRGVNQICKYNLGFDIDWTPMYISRARKQVWERPSNSGGGRGRIVDAMDFLYNHYRWGRGWTDLGKSEETRYMEYAFRMRGPNAFYQFFWMPERAMGKWTDERIDPGRDGLNRFAEFIQPRRAGLVAVKDRASGASYVSLTGRAAVFPMFLASRCPLPKPGTYAIRYRCDGRSALATINPEDYSTEFDDPETCLRRRHVERIALPPTEGEWNELSFELAAPPERNLVKLEFRTAGKRLDLEWLKTP